MSKIIQIAITSGAQISAPVLVALTDDGRIFVGEFAGDTPWRELPLPEELTTSDSSPRPPQ